MSSVKAVSAWTIGTNGEALTVSNSGWTTNTSFWGGQAGAIQVSNACGTAIAYMPASGDIVSAGYAVTADPASAVQTIRAILHRAGSPSDGYVYVCGHMLGDDWIAARYLHNDASVRLFKQVNGTPTQVGSTANPTARLTADGTESELQLILTGSAGSITAEVKYGPVGSAVTVVAAQTITDAVFSSNGKAGFAFRVLASATSAIGIKEFYADDDTGGGSSFKARRTSHSLGSRAGSRGI